MTDSVYAAVADPNIFAGKKDRIPITVIIASTFLTCIVLIAIFGPMLAPHDPDATNLSIGTVGPSSEHWFGTDQLGRDIFSRIVSGAWTSVAGPVVIVLIEIGLGTALGLLAGYSGGIIDTVITRWVDLMWSLPGLLITIILIGIVGGGYWGAVFVLGFLSCTWDTRMMRAATLEQRGLPYIEAARTLGLGRRRIMVRHVGPNILPFIVTNACLDFAGGLTALAGLAYLGFGLAPGTANWGNMINENRTILFDNAFASMAPAVIIVLVSVSTELLGTWLETRYEEKGASR